MMVKHGQCLVCENCWKKQRDTAGQGKYLVKHFTELDGSEVEPSCKIGKITKHGKNCLQELDLS